jgi:hypothetical protein
MNFYRNYEKLKMRTSDILIRCADEDTFPPPSVLADYFGFKNLRSRENLTIIFGLYAGLIQYDLVTSNELHTHCKNNTLHSFIKEKYDKLCQENRTSKYYKEFCERGIKIDVGLKEPEE